MLRALATRQGRAFHAVQDDQRLGIQIRQIEIELLGPVGGIERRGGGAAGDGNKRGRHFGTVGQHYGNPIVAPYAHAIQRANAAFGEIAQALTGQGPAVGRADRRSRIAARRQSAPQSCWCGKYLTSPASQQYYRIAVQYYSMLAIRLAGNAVRPISS